MSPRALAYVVMSLLGLWFVMLGVTGLAALPMFNQALLLGASDASDDPLLMVAGSALNAIVPFVLGLTIISLRRRLSVWAAGDFDFDGLEWDEEPADLAPDDLGSDALEVTEPDEYYEPELSEGALRRVALLVVGIYLLAQGLSTAVAGALGTRGYGDLGLWTNFQFISGTIMALFGAAALLAANWSHRDRYGSRDGEPDTWEGGTD